MKDKERNMQTLRESEKGSKTDGGEWEERVREKREEKYKNRGRH